VAKKTSELGYMIAAARKIWRWSAERKTVIERTKFFDKWKCEKCKEVVDVITKRTKKGKLKTMMPIQVDHIEPIGPQPKTWLEFGPWLDRLFCAISNLWGICIACHSKKTKSETTARAAKKAKKISLKKR
jgi:5-methylcytosine-specific restriction endonuclease McrA